MSASEALEAARAALAQPPAELPPAEFADLIGASPEILRRAKEGDEEAEWIALRGAAEVFGLDVAELLQGGAARRAPTLMLRSFIDHAHDSAFVEVVSQGVHRELGRFVRHLRRKAWLRRALGRPDADQLAALGAGPLPIDEGSRPPHGADLLAVQVRDRLGLGDEPIPSMCALMERLGVDVRYTNTLWSRIDGASVSTRQVRGVLVNLARKPRRWWRTRTTLSHELCHLLFDGGLFDGGGGGPLLIFSPAARRSEPTGEGYEPGFGQGHTSFLQVEQRANAFAAYFLAPPTGVARLFEGEEPPRSVETVVRVADRFGLSDLTAINVLKNVYQWSNQDRYDLIDEMEGQWEPSSKHPDVVAAVPADDSELRRLADEAVTAGILLRGTRDRWLGAAVETPHPPAVTTPRLGTAAEAAGEIRDLLGRGQIDASLRVLWDSVDAWIEAGDFGACRALLDVLPPDEVNSNVMVSVLAVTGRAPELAGARAAYRLAARRALAESGRSPEDVTALVGEEHADGR